MPTEKQVLDLPSAPRVRFERNTIRQAFCEFRFPTLPGLSERAPDTFVMGIRQNFPFYERGVNLQLGVAAGTMAQIPEAHHRYLSKDRQWTTWIRTSSLGVESRKYSDFEDFLGKVRFVLAAAQPCLDTDFFTRVGLRYVNILPASQEEIAGWVNEDLLGPLARGVFGTVQHHLCRTQGQTELGQFTFQHGVVDVEGEGERYVLDADFSAEAVEWDDAMELLEEFNAMNFQLYSWAIGDKTREYLGEGTPKES